MANIQSSTNLIVGNTPLTYSARPRSDEVDAGFNMGGHISSRGRGRDRMSGATQLGYRIGYWIAEWLWRRWRRR
jgi:hypothetical protein